MKYVSVNEESEGKEINHHCREGWEGACKEWGRCRERGREKERGRGRGRRYFLIFLICSKHPYSLGSCLSQLHWLLFALSFPVADWILWE